MKNEEINQSNCDYLGIDNESSYETNTSCQSTPPFFKENFTNMRTCIRKAKFIFIIR